MTYTRDVITD